MLARLKMGAWRVLDVQVESAACPSSTDEGDVMIIDLDVLRNLVFPLPSNAWRRVVQCGTTIPPMCWTLQNMIRNDCENVVRVLSGLEPTWEYDILNEAADDYDNPCPMNLGSCYDEPEPYLPSQSHSRKRPRFLRTGNQTAIPLTSHPSVPTIVITPCETQEPEASCRVPLQNCAFGNRLTVPRHPVYNRAFPPLSLSPYALPVSKKWRWQEGHWQATLPSLEEQAQKGLFSRALAIRRSRRTRITC